MTTICKNIVNLILRSIQLDLQFLIIPKISFSDKILFIFSKYILILKNFVFGFKLGKSYIKIFSRKYFYDDKFGISFLQSLYVDNAFLKKYITRDGVVVDIGANVGQFNFFCKNYLKARKIYSFEPVKQTYKILTRNVEKNIYNYAITNKSSLHIYIPNTSLAASNFQASKNDQIEKVKCKKIDDIEEIQNESHIDLFKIDTEGSEYDVIQASRDIIKKSKYILIEVSITRKSSGTFLDTMTILKNIIPNVQLIYIGRYFENNGITEAVDMLFCNE